MIKTCYFGGGCFWCTEAIFKKINGVVSIFPGYMGGHVKNPSYELVCEGYTGHAEIIKIDYDSSKILFEDLLSVFFSTHDPTTLNRQGNDIGSQYRSIIFYESDKQKKLACDSMRNRQSKFEKKIVTQITHQHKFYRAEEYHQNYFDKNNLSGCSI